MIISSTRKFLYVIFVFAIINVSFAKTDDTKIVCPPVNIIQQASDKIDTASGGRYDDSYATSVSSSYYEKDTRLSWFLSVFVPYASSAKDAIAVGRTTASNIQFSKSEYATVYTDNYGILRISCAYGPGDVHASGRRLYEEK